jgi:hypothetical protein
MAMTAMSNMEIVKSVFFILFALLVIYGYKDTKKKTNCKRKCRFSFYLPLPIPTKGQNFAPTVPSVALERRDSSAPATAIIPRNPAAIQ